MLGSVCTDLKVRLEADTTAIPQHRPFIAAISAR
jgi:hypothetical protein